MILTRVFDSHHQINVNLLIYCSHTYQYFIDLRLPERGRKRLLERTTRDRTRTSHLPIALA